MIQLNLEKKKSILQFWILALGKLCPGEYTCLSRTCLVCWKSLKTNTSGCIIAETFHHEGAVSWSHTVKRVREGTEFLFSFTPVKILSAGARLFLCRLDLSCSPLVLQALRVLKHKWNSREVSHLIACWRGHFGWFWYLDRPWLSRAWRLSTSSRPRVRQHL